MASQQAASRTFYCYANRKNLPILGSYGERGTDLPAKSETLHTRRAGTSSRFAAS